MSLATQSLKATSTKAAQLWRELNRTQDPQETEQLFRSLWESQTAQELATDAMAALAEQIDAEIAAIHTRLKHLVELHSRAIGKLEGWRNQLDHTILSLNESGILAPEVVGKQRRITVKENPPTCEILVKPEQLPEAYRTEKTQVTLTANKKAITAAWLRGEPVDGTHVYRKRRVVYDFLAGNSLQAFDSTKQSSPKKHRQV